MDIQTVYFVAGIESERIFLLRPNRELAAFVQPYLFGIGNGGNKVFIPLMRFCIPNSIKLFQTNPALSPQNVAYAVVASNRRVLLFIIYFFLFYSGTGKRLLLSAKGSLVITL